MVPNHDQKQAHARIAVAHVASTGITRHALELDRDAIVIGSGDKRGPLRLFLGSVAVGVANRAPCIAAMAR